MKHRLRGLGAYSVLACSSAVTIGAKTTNNKNPKICPQCHRKFKTVNGRKHHEKLYHSHPALIPKVEAKDLQGCLGGVECKHCKGAGRIETNKQGASVPCPMCSD